MLTGRSPLSQECGADPDPGAGAGLILRPPRPSIPLDGVTSLEPMWKFLPSPWTAAHTVSCRRGMWAREAKRQRPRPEQTEAAVLLVGAWAPGPPAQM